MHCSNTSSFHSATRSGLRRTDLRNFLICLLAGLVIGTAPACADEQNDVWVYVFKQGDNLWDVSVKYLGGIEHWKQLQELNGVSYPRRMPPGTQVSIPLRWLKVDPTKAKVVASYGANAYSSPAGAPEKPLSDGTVLQEGDQIRVSENGNAVLEFADGSLMQLAESTVVDLQRVNKFNQTGIADTESLLTQGRAETRVNAGGTRFEISTPSASSAVRGTEFRTSVDPADPSRSLVEVLAGVVGVSGGGRTRELQAGYGTAIFKDTPPEPPVKLLPAPAFKLPEKYSREFPVVFKWQPVAGAANYRLQVWLADQEIAIIDEITRQPAFSTNALADARYAARVRAIDETGIEGLDNALDFELDAQPQPPAVISPTQGQVVRTKLPAFEWAKPTNADRFRFELSFDPEFKSLVTGVHGVEKTLFTPKELAPGTYFWRLASLSGEEQGPFGRASTFILRPAPDAPAVSTEGDEKALTIRWSPAREGQHYRLQVAEEETFLEAIVDERLDSPEWQMERPKSSVFFRVQVIDVDGFQGAWSLPQRIDPPPFPGTYRYCP